MSPNVIRDEFSHIPDANKRMRARWAKAGRCARCGEDGLERKKDGTLYAYGPKCRAVFAKMRQSQKQRRVA